jgi:hypothetical protein
MTTRDRILARADLNAMRAARDITGLAAALNAENLMAIGPCFVTFRGILTGCGALGSGIVAALKGAAADPAIGVAVDFLKQKAGLDVGDPYTQGEIDKMVPSVLTAPQALALKAIAMQRVVVTQEQVALEMYNPDGTEK